MRTEMMEIYPAIDVLGGKVVRLLRGDYDAATTYGDSVEDQVAIWKEAGARWVHLIDLDGARTGVPDPDLWQAATGHGVSVQLGGGVRDVDDVLAALECGITRVIMGTSAVWTPEVLSEAIARSSADQVVAAIDVRDSRAGGAGWMDEGRDFERVVKDVLEAGVTGLLVTSIRRDGTLKGPDFELLDRVRALAPDAVIMAAGGIACMDDLIRLDQVGIDGAVIGRALYERTINLKTALVAFDG